MCFQEGKCAYGIIVVAIYWMTECLPLAVTAIMPVVLMTWLGVMDSREICKNYLKVIVRCMLSFNQQYKSYDIKRGRAEARALSANIAYTW